MSGPLDGIKVIEVGQALAGPLAGAILGDMGADVLKVEKPDGGDDARLWGPPFVDGDSLAFHMYNRNKRSVTLDIKNPDDIAALKAMVRDADVMIQNLRPGIVDDVGIGAEAMLLVNPRLIYCSILGIRAHRAAASGARLRSAVAGVRRGDDAHRTAR
jgi:crotonobetainyl-CoA:carnitine CoA-transferase CaiB-like acyl-CoA transferase